MEMNELELNITKDKKFQNQEPDQLPQTQNNARISTGIAKLDEMLSGGYPKGRVILVSGTPGSGKTIFCFHYINAGIQQGEKCLYLSTDEHVDSLIQEAEEFGFHFQNAITQQQAKFIYLTIDRNDIHQQIEEEINSGGYDRIILDSLSPLAEKPIWMVNNGNEVIPQESAMTSTSLPIDSIQATRMHLRKIVTMFKDKKISTLVTSEIPEGSRTLSRDSVTEFLTDGIILLDMDSAMDRRKLMVRKMRKTAHSLKPVNLLITPSGIQLQ